MQVYLVRHAHAGQRQQDGRDIYRPLSARGRDRATELVTLFADLAIDRLLSSPATRCAQTLEPLAAARGLDIVEHDGLWEGSSIADALSAVLSQRAASIVACSHGDVIPAVIDLLAGQGVPVSGRGCELGSVWILEMERGRCSAARYVPARATALA